MKPPAATRMSGRGLRLLVVDDAADVRATLADLLHAEGYEVETAANAETALQLVQLVRWDGLVLDFDLPDLNGMELYTRIMCYAGNRLPVVFFTGRPDAVLKSGLGDVPWVRVVPKPCGGRQFMAALEHCLRAGGEAAPAAGGCIPR